MPVHKVQSRIEEKFRKTVGDNPSVRNAYYLVHSDRLGIHLSMAEGRTGGSPANPGQRYLIASISKLFTSVLTSMLIEENRLDYEDTVAKYLDADLLKGLHRYKGNEYSNEIRIKHLLGHTSGLHDFFEDKPKQGKPMLELIQDEPDRLWTPREVVEWSKAHLEPHFPPGAGFHYSDTGYHLLGLIIEQTLGKPLHEAFDQYLFRPLGMKYTSLHLYSEPEEDSGYPLADVYIGDNRMTDHQSLSVDYAGGAIVSTSEDLLIFMKALAKHELISKQRLEAMQVWSKFQVGIDYGYGLVRFKPIPLLLPKRYQVWGNFGSTGSFLFYQAELDLYLLGSFNQLRSTGKALRMMFKTIDIVSRHGKR
ncbi:serine hydrolase [Paenibacillus sp. GYB004]|uniref:serine hydrolase domain-containing protein n=1 Tax=Paenibacillus sp. GYB004 TaxID=2994393 RepID=UPI002F96B9A9